MLDEELNQRALGNKLTEQLGQQVIVDSRPGGSGVIAAEIVKALQTPNARELLAKQGAMAHA